MRRFAAALLHHPILDRQGGIVTTAITNLDLHDIARSARTFGVSDFFVAHPIAAQRELADRVREHWMTGSGARRIPDRTPALEILRVVTSLDQVLAELGGDVEIWSTSARVRPNSLSHEEARARLETDGRPVLLVFGTGWGLADAVHERAHAHLFPIRSAVSSTAP